MVWIVVSFALLLVSVLMIYIYRRRMNQKNLERETMIRDLTRLEARITELSKVKSGEKPENDTNSFTFKFIESICDSRYTLYSEGKGDEAFGIRASEIIRQLADDENLGWLERYLNEHFDNLMARFRQQTVGISQRQYNISIFVFLGFSDSTIAAIFYKNPVSNPRQERYRIRKKIKEHPTPDSSLFLKYF